MSDPTSPNLIIGNATVASNALLAVRVNVPLSLKAQAAGPVQVTYQTVDGTALAGTDYEGVSSGAITISGGGANIPITVKFRPDGTPPRQFAVRLLSATGAVIVAPGVATVKIRSS